MCGISGMLNLEGRPADREILARMCEALYHRGPDEGGLHIDGAVGIAMRRLSIIDLQSGRQPIFNEDGTVGVVCNGEIYNYRELRAGLIERGHKLRTESDTEVVVHLYEEVGDECVMRLNGMFSFAIWDARRGRLLLARDRLGIKPLYLARIGSTVLFASEIKSLLEHPQLVRQVDRRAIIEYLAFEYIPAPRSPFVGIQKVPGGCRVICEGGVVRLERYWDVSFHCDPHFGSEDDCADAVRERLREAVRLQLRSDVPLGVLLSGGIDSSSIVALMRQLGCAVETFSIGFAERDYNELDAAGEVARRFDTHHHSVQVSAEDVKRLLPDLLGFIDEPLADASIIPTFLVSQLARRHVKVALSGDGGDELFGGYVTYKAHRIASWHRRVPSFCRSLLGWGIGRLPAGRSHMGFSFRAKKFLRGAGLSPAEQNAIWWGAYSEAELRSLLVSEWHPMVSNPLEAVERVQREFRGDEGLNRVFYQDLRMYLQDDLLVKVDRMSMANSLEVRVPYLDHSLVEFAAALPENYKVRGLQLKHILRRALQPLLPGSILRRRKHGFDLPLGPWLRGPLRELLGDTLSPAAVSETGWFNPKTVQKLVDEHLAGRHDHRQFLWPLIVCESWRRRYLGRRPAQFGNPIV